MDSCQDRTVSVAEELIKIATKLATEKNLNHLLNAIVDSARQIVRADMGLIYLLDRTKRNLYVEVFQCDSIPVNFPHVRSIPLIINGKRNDSNICVYCAHVGNVIYINDIYQYSGFDFNNHYLFDKATHYRSQSMLTLPLIDHKNITVGVLQLFNALDESRKKVITFPKTSERLVKAFAAQAAVAIDNVQLVKENKRLIRVLDETNTKLELENAKLREKIKGHYDFSNIIGKSTAMEKVYELMNKIIDSDATVLIRGETGTGKELIAHALHYNSRRKNALFIAQNCAALPETLLESELFGYRKGAFSGAVNDKIGLIERAHAGTLFLDEIGDMPLSLQAKLLRVLQDKEVRPLGSVISKKVNVRIIVATHKDLQRAVKENQFREDLYYRLSIFPITLPPLHERKDDLPALIKHFIDMYSKKYHKKTTTVSPKTLDFLMRYHYPGNIRELSNIIERALLLCEEGTSLLPEHLTEMNHDIRNGYNATILVHEPIIKDLKTAVGKYEASLIQYKLRECNWNQSKAAEELNIARRTLIEKMHRYNIHR